MSCGVSRVGRCIVSCGVSRVGRCSVSCGVSRVGRCNVSCGVSMCYVTRIRNFRTTEEQYNYHIQHFLRPLHIPEILLNKDQQDTLFSLNKLNKSREKSASFWSLLANMS